jgi:HK97 family phage major capsid protein
MATSVKEFLEGQVQQKLDAAAGLSKQAESAARPNTPDEKQEIGKLLDDVTKLKSQIQEIDDQEALRERIDSIRGPAAAPIEEGTKGAGSIGEAFVKSEGFKAIKEAGFAGGRWSSGPVEYEGWNGGQKATVTETASVIIQPDVQPGILPILNWPLRIADLFDSGATTSNTVRYIEELANTNAAAGTSEGAAKPESSITFDQKDTTVGKITTFLPVSDEMLEDVAQIQSYLDQRLGMFVKIKEDSDLLNGAGSPSVTGILQVSGIQTGSALSLDTDSSIDAIYDAMTLVKTGSFLDADAIVMHPTDWSKIRLMKDKNGQYYGGGAFTGAYGVGGIAGNSLWNLPVS